jgi:hypothetical protein
MTSGPCLDRAFLCWYGRKIPIRSKRSSNPKRYILRRCWNSCDSVEQHTPYQPDHPCAVGIRPLIVCDDLAYAPSGSGAAAPDGALRAIDSSARPRLLADLRSAPPPAAIRACPGCHAWWWPLDQIGERPSKRPNRGTVSPAVCAKFVIDASVAKCLHTSACHLLLAEVWGWRRARRRSSLTTPTGVVT